MKTISIKRTELNDIDDILVVEASCFKIKWSKQSFRDEILDNDKAVYFSAINNGVTIGYGGYWKVYDEAQITNIAVHSDYRKLGIGTNLLENLINTAIEDGLKNIVLEVRESNVNARGLYEKFGFKIIGLRKSYYADNGEHALIMNKEI